jgi:hypothetical protein
MLGRNERQEVKKIVREVLIEEGLLSAPPPPPPPPPEPVVNEEEVLVQEAESEPT